MKEIIDFETTSGDKSVISIELYGSEGSPRITVERLDGRSINPEVLLGVLARYEPYVAFVKANYQKLYQRRADYVLECTGSPEYSLWHYIPFTSKYNEGIPRLVSEYQGCGIVFEGSLLLLTYMFLNYSKNCTYILEKIAEDKADPESYKVEGRELLKSLDYPTNILKARLHTTTGDIKWFRGIRNIEAPFREYWEE